MSNFEMPLHIWVLDTKDGVSVQSNPTDTDYCRANQIKYTRLDKLKWGYCPECGSDKYNTLTRYADSAENKCKDCGQIWFTDIDYTDVVKSNLGRIRNVLES